MRKDSEGKLLSYGVWAHTAPGLVGPDPLLFPTSGAGMLFPPGCLPGEALNIEAFQRLCPTNDDIWYKAMALLGDRSCQKVKPNQRENIGIRRATESALYNLNLTRNDSQIQATFEAYDLFSRL
jgi:hypothetical protein